MQASKPDQGWAGGDFFQLAQLVVVALAEAVGRLVSVEQSHQALGFVVLIVSLLATSRGVGARRSVAVGIGVAEQLAEGVVTVLVVRAVRMVDVQHFTYGMSL